MALNILNFQTEAKLLKGSLLFIRILILMVALFLALSSTGVSVRSVAASSLLSAVTAQEYAKKLSTGRDHSLALKTDGTVVAWGANDKGQTNVPANLHDVVAVAAGSAFSLALKSDGTVIAWGDNFFRQTNVPAGLKYVVAISAGSYLSLALKSDGTVVAWGANDYGQTNVPAGLNNVVAVSAGQYHSLALKSDGTVVAWGRNILGLTDVPTGLNDVVAVSAGQFYSLALRSDGTVVTWGNNLIEETNVPAGLNDVVAVSAGLHHSLALKSDGTVIAWGANNNGQTNVPTGLTRVVTVAAGTSQSLALKSDGTVIAWGANDFGQTDVSAGLNHMVAVAAGQYHSLALNLYGTVTAWGDNDNGQTVIPAGLNNVVAISTGQYHSLALKLGGTVVAWGADNYGQTDVPAGLNDVVAVSAGPYHSLALRSDSTVVAWGWNVSGQTDVPTGLNHVVAIAAGPYHSLALKSDGTVVAWGANGQSSVPAGLNHVVAVSVGQFHTLALKSDGTVVTWGGNSYGQRNVPAGLNHVVAVAAGQDYSLALRSDGTVIAWGINDNGQTDVPAELNDVEAVSAGQYHSFALRSDGTVIAWGANRIIHVPSGLTLISPTTSNSGNNSVSANPSEVIAGDTVTLTATGDRGAVAGAVSGDERYVPVSWTSTEMGKSGTFTPNGASYTSAYPTSVAGSYTVTATFQKQTWNGTAWFDAAGTPDTKTASVTVKTALSVTSVTVSPISVTVVQGTSRQLTAKVLVIGGAGQTVSWKSSDASNKVSVDSNGYVSIAGDAVPSDYIITATSTADITKSGSAIITVIPVPIYSISALTEQTTRILTQGYASGTQEVKTILVTNSGTGNLTNLFVTISGHNANDFVITQPDSSLNRGDPATSFTIKAKDHLAAGTYTANVTVSADHMDGVIFQITQDIVLPNAPPSPQNLVAAGGDRQITLTWGTVTEATYYSLYMSTVSSQFSTASVTTVTYSTYTVQNLINGTAYYFMVKAGNLGGLGAASNQASATPASSRSPNSDTGSYSFATPTTPGTKSTGVDVFVNGRKVENAGTVTTTNVNGMTVTTVMVDSKNLKEKLAAEGLGAIVTISVNTKSNVVLSKLNGQLVRYMETAQAMLEIITEQAVYRLPATQINIDSISAQLGMSAALQDIQVQIEMASPTADMMKVAENTADKEKFTVVTKPIHFTVKAGYRDLTIEVSKFKTYVERMIAIPNDIDPNKITTGVVIESDGTVWPVPTKIVSVDGKYYAVINSMTDSTYIVVWHPLQFPDVANHWAKDAVNDMGSRMIINGTANGVFDPDRNVTRAEFAAIIVRAIGLKLEKGASNFSDVKAADWYSEALTTASAYHLISGFEDGSFHPNNKITREQAMSIIAKAMAVTNLTSKLKDQSADEALRQYIDAADVNNWAKSSIAESIQAGIVSGRSSTELAPKDYITRSEVAVIMQRLLQKSGFI